jgi:hypothetical protein
VQESSALTVALIVLAVTTYLTWLLLARAVPSEGQRGTIIVLSWITTICMVAVVIKRYTGRPIAGKSKAT